MFECLVCRNRTSQVGYGTMRNGDYIPLCSRRCRTAFVEDPEAFHVALDEVLDLVA